MLAKWSSGVCSWPPNQIFEVTTDWSLAFKEALQTVWPMFKLQEHWDRSRYPRKLSIVGMNCMLITFTCQEISSYVETPTNLLGWYVMYFLMSCCITSTDNLRTTRRSSQQNYFICWSLASMCLPLGSPTPIRHSDKNQEPFGSPAPPLLLRRMIG